MRLAGRVALVTGASSGMGAATAVALAREGAAVCVAGRRAHRLAEVAARIRAAGGTATEAVVDVGDREQVNAAVQSTVDSHGKLDLVVQSAGVGYMGPAVGAEIDLWDEMIATNLVGVLNVTHAALPHLIANPLGDLVVVSSHSGRLTTADNNVYAATKFGVNAFCDSVRMEVAEYGTRVMVIEPGMTRDTEITTGRTAPHIRQAVEMFFATRPSLTPDDIANTIVHMVSQPGNVTLHEVLILPTATYGPPRQRPETQSPETQTAETQTAETQTAETQSAAAAMVEET